MTLRRYFATCARGIEPILADELRALKATDVEPGRGGVAFRGDVPMLYHANLWLRTAIRVLLPVLEVEVRSPDELYDAVKAFDWDEVMTPDHTIAVDCNVRDSAITHSMYAALRVKDAICDRMIEHHGRRPNVDTEQPMVGLNLHIYRDVAVLSLESSGDSLHKRGYRPILTRAPINEALGAAIVLMTGWRGETALVDPLCGGGTLLIEGGWIAIRRPPGLTRKRFGFQGWMDYDVRLWTDMRDEARRQVKRTLAAPIVGSDARRDAIEFAQGNARSAGIGNLLSFQISDIHHIAPPEGAPGVLICNPPYGERLGEEKELRGLYRKLGEVFKARFQGWKAFVFTGNMNLAREIGIEATSQVSLFNGKIPCKLLEYRP